MLGLALASFPTAIAFRGFKSFEATAMKSLCCSSALSSTKSQLHACGPFSLIPRGANRVSPRHSGSRWKCHSSNQEASDAESLLRLAAREHHVDAGQISKLFRLRDLLLSQNELYNLTAIRHREAVLVKHVVDALSLLHAMDKEDPSMVMDVGSGAGFPGMVLAIARPGWQVTLLDSVRKKTRFHELVRFELGLQNIRSLWARAENAGHQIEHREKYDIVVARSVGDMRELCELCLPFLVVGGCFLAQKSIASHSAELTGAEKAMGATGGRLESVSRPWSDESTQLIADNGADPEVKSKYIVSIRKASKTPTKYPRRPGVPKRVPL